MRILIAAITVIAAGLGLSWVLGASAEKGMYELAATISQNPGYEAEVTAFERGLSHSVAHIRVKPELAAALPGMEEVDLLALTQALGGIDQGIGIVIDIYQGPLVLHGGLYPGLYRAQVSLDKDSELFRRTIPGDVNLNDYFDSSFTMGFFGSGRASLEISGFSTDFGDTRLNVGGLQVAGSHGGFGGRYDMSGTLLPISLESAKESLMISAMDFESRGEISNTIGDMAMKAHFDAITGTGKDPVEIHDIDLVVDVVTGDDGTFSAGYSISLGHVESASLPTPINHLRMSVGARDLSIAGARRFYDAYSEAAASADPFTMQMAMMNSLGDLFGGTPVFEIRELSYSQGSDITLDLQASLGLTDNVFIDPTAFQNNPALLLNALTMNMDLSFSQAFMDMALTYYINDQFNGIQGMDQAFLEQMRKQQLAQMSMMSGQLVVAGYLVENGDSFSMQASFSDGQLLMNGNVLPLPF